MSSKFLTLNPGIMNADGALALALKASSTYGGVTIIAATAQTGIAGTLDLVLQNYGTSGTVAGGTVGGLSGGTATVWTANVPKALTLTAANVFIDDGEVLMLKKLEAGGSDDLSTSATISIEYVQGVVQQG